MHRFNVNKKIVLTLILFVLATTAVFAGGKKEGTGSVTITNGSGNLQTETIKELMKQESVSAKSTFFDSIASVYDEITMAVCLSMTPFPNTLVQFYGGMQKEDYMMSENLNSLNLSNSILLFEDYYARSKPVQLQIGERVYVGKSSETQKGIWNMISILFVSFLLAEIVFTAIYHYVSDKDGSVIKEILAKCVLSIGIFLVASSLPFIVEIFRVGFTEAAVQITGIDEVIKTMNKQTSQGTTDMKKLEEQGGINAVALRSIAEMRQNPVFYYPGILIKASGAIFEIMDPDKFGGSINIKDAANASEDNGWMAKFLSGLAVDILFFIVQIIGTIMILITALHVLYNVAEVYLLMGCVIILLPFTLFSPLKFLGEKAVMSLFANVLELFVIIMILFTSISIALTVTTSLTTMLIASVKTVPIDFEIGNIDAWRKEVGQDGSTYDKVYEGLKSGNENNVAIITMVFDNKSDADNIMDQVTNAGSMINSNKQKAQIYSKLGSWIENNYQELVDTLATSEEGLKTLYKITSVLKFQWNSCGYLDRDFPAFLKQNSFYSLPAGDKTMVIREIINRYGSPFAMGMREGEAERGVNPGLGVWDVYLMYLISFILVILMMTYFLNQSSSITNSLLSGNVSSEGFTGALTRLAGGAAARKIGQAAMMPAKGVGAGVKAGAAYHAANGGGAMSRLIAGEKYMNAFDNAHSSSDGSSYQSSQIR